MTGSLASLRLDRRFAAWTLAWGVIALVGFGLISAIIPNPVFGRQIPPEPFAVWVWVLSAPLLGIAGATYSAPAWAGPAVAAPIGDPGQAEAGRTSSLGAIAGLGAFLAIGCPVCNKVALLLLGTSGALSVWAPLQPLVGGASLVLLAAVVAWRLRLRQRGGACAR